MKIYTQSLIQKCIFACIALSFRVFDTLVLALIDTGEKDADLCNLECIIDLIYNLQRFARNLRVMD